MDKEWQFLSPTGSNCFYYCIF